MFRHIKDRHAFAYYFVQVFHKALFDEAKSYNPEHAKGK